MYVNGFKLLEAAPIKDMLRTKKVAHGTSYGLSELGYDIRIKQEMRFLPSKAGGPVWSAKFEKDSQEHGYFTEGRFTLASAIEEFQMPTTLGAVVHDKSTWARRGLSVFNTVIESGWKGFLTLELVYHGEEELHIPAGSGIAQVLFQECAVPACYAGKYQNQEDRPVEARASHEGPVPIITAGSVHPSNLDEACRVERQHYDHSKRGFQPK